MKTLRLNYEPTERQRLFHLAEEDEILYGGAAGGGKSTAVVMDAFLRCQKHPGTKAYLFRRSYRELDDVLLPELLMRLPSAFAAINLSSHELRLPNGSVLRFRHCEKDNDRFRYQGAEIHWLYIDELTHFPLVVYDFLKTRLRARKELGVKPLVRCTSNPGGPGHAWVRARFIDPVAPGTRQTLRIEHDGIKGERTLRYIPARVADNPHIAEGYALELAQKPEALRKALLHGDWNAFEGQVFEGFRDDPEGYGTRRFSHVIEPFEVPKSWRRFRSFDFGYSKPFSVGWWALSPEGALYRYREWYGCTGRPNEGLRLDPKQIAKEIAQSEKAHEKGLKVVGYADPSIFDGSRGESIARQMEREGVFFEPAENARLPGLMQVQQRLRFDEEGFPGLYVFKGCRASIRCIPALNYDPVRVEDVDTNAEDHIYDEWRYLLMANPMPGRKKPARKPFNPLDL
ncbi:MAG: phage terminase large subunit [Christensenellaceae bacterium]|jgi:hypothetical protein|nr:phage terminase large subunit [Christensenellaceae bacterium]